MKTFRTIPCTSLLCELREKEQTERKHKAEMQELFHIHFTLLDTSASFFIFLEHFKEAMKLIRTFSFTTLV